MAMEKAFPTEVVLSAATGILICPFSEMQRFLTFMAGEDVFTHQTPRVSKETGVAMLKRYPELSTAYAEADQITQDNWSEWRDRWIERYGQTLIASPLTADEHESIDALSEAAEFFHPDKLITITKGE